MLHEQDGGSSFSQSTFEVPFFVLHPTEVSAPPDKNLDYLTFRKKFIMHTASIIEKNKQHCCHSQAYLSYFLGVRRSRTLPV
jgi:hypothetical protein